MTWLGFAVSLGAILLISKRNLGLALICGAAILGLFTLPVETVYERFVFTLSDFSIIVLALAMGIIPIIGAALSEGGQIDNLVNNLRIPQKYLLAASAAFMGLLPMPGGALLSAPILEKGGAGVEGSLKAAINNWYRHLMILVYPLSPALIVATELADLDIYRAILYLLPAFFLALIIGHLFFLRPVGDRRSFTGRFSRSRLLIPLMIILSAPVLDFTLKRLLTLGAAATLIAVTVSLSLAIVFSTHRLTLRKIIIGARPWNFSAIIIGMYFYLHVFQASHTADLITDIPLPPLYLAITAGFALSLLTGRVQLPVSIILPIYLGATDSISLFIFSLIYAAIYFGYIISPVHPCLIVTCEYFQVPIRAMILRLAAPTLIILAAVLMAAWLVI